VVPPPPPAGAQASAGGPLKVGAAVQSAKLISHPTPVYPPVAKSARVQGTVVLQATIGTDGTVQNLVVLSADSPLLVPSAIEAVKQWVYQPTLLNGNPVQVVTEITVNFTLQDSNGTAAAPAAQTAPLAPGVYRAGSGVSNPVPTYRPEPKYSEEARKAKWQGAVLLSLVVDATGTPTSIKIVRPLGLGLDEKAIEAVQQWQFKPGMKDGAPVPVQAQIEVTFRLLDDPPAAN
jgi:TonB family protein